MINLDLDFDLYYTYINVLKKPTLFLFQRPLESLPRPGQPDPGLHPDRRGLQDFDRQRRLHSGWPVLVRSYPPHTTWINHREGELPGGNENTQGVEY